MRLTHIGLILLFCCGLFAVLEGCSSLPEDQVAYNSCVSAYNSKRQGLAPNWAFASGVNGEDGSCYWHWGAASADEASRMAITDCNKGFSNCYVFATNAGLTGWAQTISNNGGRAQDTPKDLSDKCKLGLFESGLHLGADIAASVTGNTVPYDGSEVDPNDCAGE